MNTLVLTRKKDPQSEGTPGTIELDDTTFYTLEQIWNQNIPFVSCIPVGLYELIPWDSKRYGPCYAAVNEKLNVFFSSASPNRPETGRYKCLFFHRGNYVRNFKGCSGVGEKYNPAHDMITNTTQTCRIVNNLIKSKGIRLLEIKEH